MAQAISGRKGYAHKSHRHDDEDINHWVDMYISVLPNDDVAFSQLNNYAPETG